MIQELGVGRIDWMDSFRMRRYSGPEASFAVKRGHSGEKNGSIFRRLTIAVYGDVPRGVSLALGRA